jgi:tetratricopeptide (TPR) repeat protein
MLKHKVILILQQSTIASFRQLQATIENLARKYTDAQWVIVPTANMDISLLDFEKEKIFATFAATSQVVLAKNDEMIRSHEHSGNYFILSVSHLDVFKPLYDKVLTSAAEVMYAKLQAEKKASIGYRFKAYWHQLLGLEQVEVLESNALVMSKNAAQIVLPSIQLATSNVLFEAMYNASKNKLSMEAVEIKYSKKIAFSQSIWATFKLRLCASWNWNIVSAIKQSKTIKLSLTQGNHPTYRLVFAILTFLLLLGIPYLSFDYGILWDEKIENTYSKDVLNYYLTFGKDTSCLDTNKPLYSHQINYGPFMNLAGTVVYKYVSPFGEFETRHLLVAILSALGIIFTGRIAKLIVNPAAGVIAMLCLTFSPHYFGFGMNNHKDIPFAAGYIISAYYLIRFLLQLPKPSAAIITKLILAFALTISVRIGGLLLLAYLGMFMGLFWLYYYQKQGSASAVKLIPGFLKLVLLISGISYFAGIFFWPWAMQAPLTNPIVALTEFTKYSNIKNYELFEGNMLFMSDKPWYYLPKHIFINTPLFIWFALGAFIALFPFTYTKKALPIVGVLVFMSLFPMVYAIYKNANLYNGWRQFIFIYPPLVVLATIGFNRLISMSNTVVYRWVISIFMLANIAYIGVWMVNNHPQQYVYFNETVGGNEGAIGNYELDYYSNSCREAAEWVAHQTGNQKVVVAINNEPLCASYFSDKLNPNMQLQWVREYEEQRPAWDYLIVTTRTLSHTELTKGSYPPKGTVYEVNVGGAPICVVIKRENYFMPNGYKAMEKQQADSAIYFFTKAVSYDDKSEEAYRMLGSAYAAKGSIDSAMRCFDKAIALCPQNYSAYNNKAMVYYNQKNFQQALDMFNKVIKLKINHTESYYYAGAIHLQQGNNSDAIKYYLRGIEQNATVPDIYYNLGLAYFNNGSYAKAEEALTSCLNLAPSNAMGYRLIAEVFSKQNKTQQAQYCMQKYYELGGK